MPSRVAPAIELKAVRSYEPERFWLAERSWLLLCLLPSSLLSLREATRK